MCSFAGGEREAERLDAAVRALWERLDLLEPVSNRPPALPASPELAGVEEELAAIEKELSGLEERVAAFVAEAETTDAEPTLLSAPLPVVPPPWPEEESEPKIPENHGAKTGEQADVKPPPLPEPLPHEEQATIATAETPEAAEKTEQRQIGTLEKPKAIDEQKTGAKQQVQPETEGKGKEDENKTEFKPGSAAGAGESAKLGDFPARTVYFAPAPLPAPPAEQDRLTFTIDDDTVTLVLQADHTEKTYRSPNAVDHNRLAHPETLSPREYGAVLFRGIVQQTGADGLEGTAAGFTLARDSGKPGAGLGIGLDIIHDTRSYRYRWEYFADSTPNSTPFATDECWPFYRLEGTTAKAPVTARPVRFLFALCSPADLGPASRDPNLQTLEPLNLVVERNIIDRAMQRLAEQGLDVKYKILSADIGGSVTIDAVRAELNAEPFHVLHLLAHGGLYKPRGGDGEYKLYMQNAQGGCQPVGAADFDKPMLGRDLRLVVLASCQSGNLALDQAGARGGLPQPGPGDHQPRSARGHRYAG